MYTYTFTVNGKRVEVCREAVMNVLSISTDQIRHVTDGVRNSTTGTPKRDQRGQGNHNNNCNDKDEYF